MVVLLISAPLSHELEPPANPARFRQPELELRKGVTKHRLLTDRIVEDIESGSLAPETQMPTHRELAHRLGLSVQTVSISYKEAERRGYLRGEVGRGTFGCNRVTERADRFMLDRDPNGTADLSIIRAVYMDAHENASRNLFEELSNADEHRGTFQMQ